MNNVAVKVTNGAGQPAQTNPAVDYEQPMEPFMCARYVIEVCHKLQTKAVTTATALSYFHTFYYKASFEDYDPFTIGCTCILLASKVVDDNDVRIRDIINVGVSCLKPLAPPLMLEPYFGFRDSLTQCELLLMRALGFKLKVDLPHKYILFYLQSLQDWIGRDAFSSLSIGQLSWSILQDAFHDPLCIQHPPQLVAATCCLVALEVVGVAVPRDDAAPWYTELHPSCTKEAVSDLCVEVLALYEKDKALATREDK